MYNLKCFPYNLYQNDHLTELGTERYTVETHIWCGKKTVGKNWNTTSPPWYEKHTAISFFTKYFSYISGYISDIYLIQI